MQSYSRARAARCASVTRLALALPALNNSRYTVQWFFVGTAIRVEGCFNQLSTRAIASSSVRGRSKTRGFVPIRIYAFNAVQHKYTGLEPESCSSHQERAWSWLGLKESSAYRRMLASTKINANPLPQSVPATPVYCPDCILCAIPFCERVFGTGDSLLTPQPDPGPTEELR